jgi:MFS family permease
MSVLNLGGRFAGGFLGDRFSKQWVLLGSMTLTAGSLVLFALARSFAQVVVFAVLYGFAWGLRAPVTNSLQGDIFGRAAFGRISGMLQVVSSPLSLIGPVLAGYLADVMGSYDLAFILLACSSGVGGGLFFLVRPPRKRRQNVGVV